MKVIQQLIAYFAQRGRLSRQDLEQFAAGGYWGQNKPGQLPRLANQIGQSFIFQVTGDIVGPLWGTDVYTSDSNLATACVHAGVLGPDETGLVQVTMVQPPPSFRGSQRNGVSSSSYQSWPGAFRVEALAK
jgi:hypothetical protein